MKQMRHKVLFLCTGNSARSQMAEGFARAIHGDLLEVYSAGVEPKGVNLRAIAVMGEAGIDISGHRSKHVDELADVAFDVVISVCDHANETCPVFPVRVKRLHVGFDDPPVLERGARSEEEALGHWRRVREEIRAFVGELPMRLEREAPDDAARS